MLLVRVWLLMLLPLLVPAVKEISPFTNSVRLEPGAILSWFAPLILKSPLMISVTSPPLMFNTPSLLMTKLSRLNTGVSEPKMFSELEDRAGNALLLPELAVEPVGERVTFWVHAIVLAPLLGILNPPITAPISNGSQDLVGTGGTLGARFTVWPMLLF